MCSEPLALACVGVQMVADPVRFHSHTFGLEAAPCSLDTHAAVFLRPEALQQGGLDDMPEPVGVKRRLLEGRSVTLALSVPFCSNPRQRTHTDAVQTGDKSTHAHDICVPVLEGDIRRKQTSEASLHAGQYTMPTMGTGEADCPATAEDQSAFESTRVRFIDVTAVTAQANSALSDPRDGSVIVPCIVNCLYASTQAAGGAARKPRWKRRRVIILDHDLESASGLQLIGLTAHTLSKSGSAENEAA